MAGLTSEEWGMEVVCLYVGQANPALVETELRQILPGFMIPKRWRQVTGLPMTPMGKPDRVEAARFFS